MKPHAIDLLTDVMYGMLLVVSLLFLYYGNPVMGGAFGTGALLSWGLHLFWKMARYDPNWMKKAIKEGEISRRKDPIEPSKLSVEKEWDGSATEKVNQWIQTGRSNGGNTMGRTSLGNQRDVTSSEVPQA